MRRILRLGLALAAMLTAGLVPVEAAKYAVSCVAEGVPGCKTACSSNTYTVACYARVVNGRCQKSCGRVR
jgi:hypothetical protein